VPLRTPLGNGDVVEIIKSRNSEPQLSWLGFAVTGKARAAIRRAVRQKERAEVALIGRKLYDEIAERLATPVGKKALADAVKRLKLNSEEDLMVAIGTAKLDDRQVMEALVPGSTANLPNPELAARSSAPSPSGADAGHGLQAGRLLPPGAGRPHRRPAPAGQGVEVHAIDCEKLADGVDADWIDLSWDKRTDGAVGRIRAELYNRPGTLAEMAGIFAKNHANVVNLEMTQRENPFHTYLVDLEVRDLAHLTRIISALRASDAVAQTASSAVSQGLMRIGTGALQMSTPPAGARRTDRADWPARLHSGRSWRWRWTDIARWAGRHFAAQAHPQDRRALFRLAVKPHVALAARQAGQPFHAGSPARPRRCCDRAGAAHRRSRHRVPRPCRYRAACRARHRPCHSNAPARSRACHPAHRDRPALIEPGRRRADAIGQARPPAPARRRR
jgi:hypothetical protein